MAGIRQEGDFRCTIERQAVWGTPINTAPIGLNTVDLKITHEGDRHMIPVDRGIRFDYEDDRFVDTASTFPVCSFSCPITTGMLKTVLPGLLQNASNWTVATGAVDMFPQVPASLPTPRAITGTSGGYAYSIVRRSPTASQSERISDAICRRLKISLHPTNNGGLLWGEWEFIGTTYTHTLNLVPGDSPSITQDSLAATVRYSWGDLDDVLVDGGADLLTDFVSFELDMTFGAKFAGDTPRGEVLFPRWESTFTGVFGQNTQTQAYEAYSRSQAISTGRPIVIRWGDGTLSEAGEMNLTIFGNVESFDDSDRAEGETHTIVIKGEQGGTSTEYPVRFNYYTA